ncbi:MAG: hypothetical protein ACRCR9_02210, partial [Chitinophagaceae bacterium]
MLFIQQFMEKYRWIILISILGFVGTGILPYPYGVSYDDFYSVTDLSNFSDPQRFSTWLGWFYPVIWNLSRNILKVEFGVFNNIIYWSIMPLLYIRLFDFLKQSNKVFSLYTFWYFVFTFCPFMIISLTNMHNSQAVLSFLLLGLYFVVCYYKDRKILSLLLCLIFFICATLIRRDALFFMLPMIVVLSLLQQGTLRKILVLILFLVSSNLINTLGFKIIGTENPKAGAFSTIDYIVWYDLAAMSYHKKEMVIPDQYFRDTYKRSDQDIEIPVDKNEALNIIYEQFNNHQFHDMFIYPYNMTYGITYMLNVSPRIEHIPHFYLLYLKNLPFYVWHRLTIFYKYLFVNNSYHVYDFFYTEYGLYETFAHKYWRKLASIFSGLGVMSLIGYFVILLGVFVSLLFFQNMYTKDQKIFLYMLATSSLISLGILIVAVTSVQLRYAVWFVL